MDSEMKNVEDYPSVDFSGDCGEASGSSPYSATGVGMQPFQSATVNGSPCNNCVVGNDDAKVFNVWLTKGAFGIYTYQICVDGQGPKGIFGGSFYLAFTDATGDTYHLSLYSHTRKQHTVDFNSSNPAIVKISWCDNSFVLESSKTDKPEYRVTSPSN